MKKFALIMAFSTYLTVSGNTAETLPPSKLIISTFGIQCPQVLPRNVGAALVNLDSLYGIVQDLKSNNDCNGAGQLANVLSSYSGIFQDFKAKQGEAEQQLILEKQIAQYTQLLSNPTISTSQVSYLQDQIVQAQTNLVNIKSGLTRFQSFSGRESRGANELVSSLDGFLTNTLANQGNACYEKNKAQVTNLISNVLMTTAAFAAPGASLALASSGVITSTLGKYLINFKYNQELSKINDTEMPLALRCVSEVLTEQYCAARETVDLINERIDNQNTSSTKYDGINLLSFQLNQLSTWLDAIHAGSAINSEGDLLNREKPIKQSELLDQIQRAIEAYSAQQYTILTNIPNDAARSRAIAGSFEFLVQIISSGNVTGPNPYMPGNRTENPLFRSMSAAAMPYAIYSLGALTAVPQCNGGNDCSSLAQYLQGKPLLGMDNWNRSLAYTIKMISDSMSAINIARAKTVSVDARSILADATRSFTGDTNAYNALLKIKKNAIRIGNYLTALDNGTNQYLPQISNIKRTQTITEEVIALLDESFIPRTTPENILPFECRGDHKDYSLSLTNDEDQVLEQKSFQITSCISKILKLEERGTDVFFTKIRNMVSYEMEARFLRHDLGDGVIDLINSTKDDLVKTILNSYSSSESSMSVGQVKGSLEDTQNTSRATLEQFFSFFQNDILKALKSGQLQGFAKNDFCFRLLPYLDNSKGNLIKEVNQVCSGAVMQDYKNGPSIRFSDYIQKIPAHGIRSEKVVVINSDNIAERFCKYRKYNHANQLVELQNAQIKREQNLKAQFFKMHNKFGAGI